MADQAEKTKVYELIDKYSSGFDYSIKETAIILAAGHGKRIRSATSKMLHKIWGISTVERVFNACKEGFDNVNIIVVVGIKAPDVLEVFGKRENTLFAYQEDQNGTGHAVQVALEKITHKYDGTIYVLPGDMGLIDGQSLKKFKTDFVNAKTDMMVLTGLYEGEPDQNSYGRILRAKENDPESKSSINNVIEIMEHKDILNLASDKPYAAKLREQTFLFTKQELLANNEYNSGVFAFDFKKLNEQITRLHSNNVQGELYLTDLISLFNDSVYTVGASSPIEQYTIMGFNNKEVLKEMESIARKNVYNKLKNIIEIDDPDDFFICESIADELLKMDAVGKPLDVHIGKGAHVGRGAKLNYRLELGKNVNLSGNINFGTEITIQDSTTISCFPGQKMILEDNVKILNGNIIKGVVRIGKNSQIESHVHITGNDEFPINIGENVTIKGTTYIFGSKIGDNSLIEHSVLIKKEVENNSHVRFVIPPPEGLERIKNLK